MEMFCVSKKIYRNKFYVNKYINWYTLKGQCHEIFDLYFFSLIEPIWSPDKQAKMVFLKNSFSQRYSNLKFEKIDSAQANTARSRFFFQSQPFKKLIKNVGFGLYSTPMDSVLFYIPFKGKERPPKTKLFPAKLRAVLVTFGFSEN